MASPDRELPLSACAGRAQNAARGTQTPMQLVGCCKYLPRVLGRSLYSRAVQPSTAVFLLSHHRQRIRNAVLSRRWRGCGPGGLALRMTPCRVGRGHPGDKG